MLPYWLWVGELDSKTCDLIIEKSHQFKLKQAEIHDSNGNPIKNDTRISDIRWVQEDDFLYSLVHRYFVHANRQFGVDTAAVYEVQYTEYKGGQIVIQLSDPSDYEGGNFLFWNDSPEGFKERGSVLVFPSFRPHKVEPVTKGLRRSLVSWIEGLAWR
jgi:PKHD-type hydroxylase